MRTAEPGLHSGIAWGRGRAVAPPQSSSEHNVRSLETGVLPALIQRHARISHLSQHWCSGCMREVLGRGWQSHSHMSGTEMGGQAPGRRAGRGVAESLPRQFWGLLSVLMDP